MPRKPKRRFPTSASSSNTSSGGMHDLDVPLVLASKSNLFRGTSQIVQSDNSRNKKSKPTAWRGTKQEQSALIQRLGSQGMGYSTIALSHQVYGRVKPGQDEAHIAIPDSIVTYTYAFANGRERDGEQPQSSKLNDSTVSESENRKRKANELKLTSTSSNLKILKRLNVIIEQESDLAHYGYGGYYKESSNNTDTTVSNEKNQIKQILKSYDIIAFSPKNETVLSAICNSNSQSIFYADIIMLDYTAGRGGIQLPFKLKKTYISSASKSGIAFELPYGPALIDPSKRKAMVQTARLFLNASVGVLKPRPRIIVSSGGRMLDRRDYGAMVLRSSGDILNLCKVVLGLGSNFNESSGKNSKGRSKNNNGGDAVCKIMGEHACEVVERGRNRKMGKIFANSLTYQLSNGQYIEQGVTNDEKGDGDNDDDDDILADEPDINNQDSEDKNDDNDVDDDDEDGFLRL